jgi:excinuclease ABC subunit A
MTTSAPSAGKVIDVKGASAHNLKNVDVTIERGKMTVVTGVSGSGKSSLAFDTILAEAQRRFFHTLSHYSRQFLDLQGRPPVRSISGLSPAISLAQNETMPSRRATVGTLTDVTELLGVVLARFGEQRCPVHDLPTSAQSAEAIAARIAARADGDTVAVLAPIAKDKKGTFKAALTAFAERGYLRAEVDGQLVMLASAPALAREERHTIKLIVDYVKVKDATKARLLRAVETALKEAEGFVEWRSTNDQGALDDDAQGGQFSAKGGCPTCGYSWPKLDARYFSSNSLGKCVTCDGYGVTGGAAADSAEADEANEASNDAFVSLDACSVCDGTGLAAKLAGIRLAGKTPQQLHTLPVAELAPLFVELLSGELGANAAALRVLEEMSGSLRRIVEIGLGYLSISRRIRSLSGGEAQRLKLAGILGDNLRGVLYVLDEPSQGLATAEIERLASALHRLRDAGNTVIVVDHDETLMRRADWIVDLGPGGGARGGKIMAHFKPADAAHFTKQSLTARHLAAPAAAPRAPAATSVSAGEISVSGARLHNLSIPNVTWPLGALSVVTGVSGAGKTSLVLGTLYAGLAKHVTGGRAPKVPKAQLPGPAGATIQGHGALTNLSVVDRKPIAKSGVSLPASYLGVLTELRDLYASLPDAQVMGLTARSFSLSVEGGRCPECKGRGELSLTMRFLADARVRCPVCQGQRFRPQILQVKWQGLSMAEVLELTLEEALELFQHHRRIASRLAPAAALGLGYLKLGQPSASLSGGEAQRLKLVPHLAKAHGAGSLIILDEPTTGLHFQDIDKLIAVLRRLTESGATVITIEHHPDVIAAADWLVELGPGSAQAGGKLVYAGPPTRKNPS